MSWISVLRRESGPWAEFWRALHSRRSVAEARLLAAPSGSLEMAEARGRLRECDDFINAVRAEVREERAYQRFKEEHHAGVEAD